MVKIYLVFMRRPVILGKFVVPTSPLPRTKDIAHHRGMQSFQKFVVRASRRSSFLFLSYELSLHLSFSVKTAGFIRLEVGVRKQSKNLSNRMRVARSILLNFKHLSSVVWYLGEYLKYV